MKPCLRIAVTAAAALLLLPAWLSPVLAGPAPGATVSLADNVSWDLDQVVQIALARHPLVSQADADIQAAAARKGQAQSSYYPQIGLSTGYARSRAFSPPSNKASRPPPSSSRAISPRSSPISAAPVPR